MMIVPAGVKVHLTLGREAANNWVRRLHHAVSGGNSPC